MYIQPTTNIRLLKDVPLDTSYDHTIYFESATAQYNYFIGLQKYNLTNYTYQRVKRGVARVGIKADNMYDCNYMMFQNTAYGNKWFYAFITAVEFVNNECAEIYFELDVMQTWLFDCEPDYCFVEREHSITDNIGDNIIPENLECGEYVFNDYSNMTKELDPLCIIIVVRDNTENPDGTLYDGVYGGCTLFAYNKDDIESINGKLETYNQKPDAIVAMYMCPVIGVGKVIEKGGTKLIFSKSSYTVPKTQDKISSNLSLDGYKPKNKKLYTYPYNFLQISSGKNNGIYRYEFFDDLTPSFEINVPITLPIQISLRPKKYKGSGNLTLNSETIILDDYPMCSWNTDSFKAWVAQNSLPIAATVGAIAGSAVLGIAGATIPAMLSTIGTGSVINLLSQGYRASISADIGKGNINSGNIDVASGNKSFFGGRCSLSSQYARIIDDYFSVYGYATKKVKIPNRNSRPHWNYVKTVGATVTGSVPADDMRKICGIYDNGITFWKKGSEVGQYNLDNTV